MSFKQGIYISGHRCGRTDIGANCNIFPTGHLDLQKYGFLNILISIFLESNQVYGQLIRLVVDCSSQFGLLADYFDQHLTFLISRQLNRLVNDCSVC